MKKWSISAHNCFQRCQRQYFFRYIMAHHNAKDDRRREAYLRKQLSSLDAWKGRLIHLALEKYFTPSLQQGELISCTELLQKTIVLGKRQFKFSQQKKYSQAGVTKANSGDRYLALKLHEDKIELKKQDLETVFLEIQQCYQNLYADRELIDFLVDKADWYETEFRLSFKFNGVTIIGQPDLLIGYQENKICVIDWKTGKSKIGDYSTQLYLYALAVVNSIRWSDYNLQDLLLVEANLLQNKFEQHSLDRSQELKIENFLSDSISDIQAVTGNHKYNLNALKNYSYANSPVACQYCNFRHLCQSLT